MHEMSIVKGIIAIAETEAKKAKVKKFSAINLEIGILSGIEYDALDFVWEIAVQNSVLENAKKSVHKVLAKAQCNTCNTTYAIKFFHDACPKCGSFEKKILQGKELRIKSLETL